MELLTDTYLFENSLFVWSIALLASVVTFFFLLTLRRFISRRLHRLAEATSTRVDDLVTRLLMETKGFFILALSLRMGALVLALEPQTRSLLSSAMILILLAQGAVWGHTLIAFWMAHYHAHKDLSPASATTLAALGFMGRLLLWSVLLLLALDNVGVDVTALIAGLGVGSIAVALAVQNILGDLFASLSIVFDKPFEIGDFIIVGDFMGTVEHIGLRTTRVRSLSGEQLVFPNSDLLGSRIRNYQRMQERRIAFTLGVTYGTPAERLARVPEILKETVTEREHARFDRAHFKEYGDFALLFEVVYFVLSADYNLYMDVQQAINLAVYERFEKEGIEFAFPTQTLHLRAEPGFGTVREGLEPPLSRKG